MDSNDKVTRVSSDTDREARDANAHPDVPDVPDGWSSTEVTAALRAVLLAIPGARRGMADRLGLNPSEVDAMEHVMTGEIGPVELSRRLHMASASATVLVDRLQEAGHVVREADSHDGRRRLVRATPSGVAAVFGQIGPLVSDLAAAEEGLTDSERAAVAEYLRRILTVLQQHSS